MKDLRTVITLVAVLLAWLAFIDRPNLRTLAHAVLATAPLTR